MSDWKYAGASIIGTSHSTTPDGVCQDAHACEYIGESGTLFAVVSDGAGSASYSHLGSRHTCDYVLAAARTATPDLLVTPEFADDVFHGLRASLNDLADSENIWLRQLACTLIVAVVQEHRAAFWQIGDGAICFRLRSSDSYKYAFWPEKGEYANVTNFVTDDTAKQHLDIDAVDADIVELALFSDGLERLALNFASGEPHAPFFDGLFPYLHKLPPGYSDGISDQLSQFLGSERINKRTDDDKTLILAARKP